MVSQERRLWKISPHIVLTFVVAFFIFGGVSQVYMQPNSGDAGGGACAVTPELLAGQGGFAVTGLGGFAVTGLGGFAVTGLGDLTDAEIAELLAEIQGNTITPQWLLDLLPIIESGTEFNTVKTAILVVDDFSGISGQISHGQLVSQVVNELTAAVGGAVTLEDALNISVVPVDISQASYQLDIIAQQISQAVANLQANGYKHFVLNMSFGLIPCEDEETGFSFSEFLRVRSGQPDAGSQTIIPILACVTGPESGNYRARFGYYSPFASPVHIPAGPNNKFTPAPLNRGQATSFIPGYNPFMFEVNFNGSDLTWSLKSPNGETRSVTANSDTQKCASPSDPPAHDGAANPPVIPILECVVENAESDYTAFFSYYNLDSVAVNINTGGNNRFQPNPQNRGQPTAFHPGLHRFAFQVNFDGNNLTWRLHRPGSANPLTATASASSESCGDDVPPDEVILNNYSVFQYLMETLGYGENEIAGVMQSLTSKINLDSGSVQNLRALLATYLLLSADENNNFAVIPVASSGNFQQLLGSQPLAPASFPETIAVSATLGENGPLAAFSHNGNVTAPGAWYQFASNVFGAGTSYSAPYVSVISALYLTYPNACTFDGVHPPLTFPDADDFVNAIFTSTSLENATPLNCQPTSGTASITIIKDAQPDSETSFDFSGDLGEFSLRDDGSEESPRSITFSQLVPGSYEVIETTALSSEAWILHNIVCNPYYADVSIDLENASMTIDVEADDEVFCTFINVEFVPEETSITVTKTANPESIKEPGGYVTFTARVQNTSPTTLVMLNSLVDSAFGDLNGQGTCTVPQIIEAGNHYECTFSGEVIGEAGTVHENIITATAKDHFENTLIETASATVTITADPEEPDALPVIPILECVAPTDSGYRAVFGYENKDSVQVHIPVSGNNRFHPVPQNRGQPTSFHPGRHENVFEVHFTEAAILWHLHRPGSGAPFEATTTGGEPCDESEEPIVIPEPDGETIIPILLCVIDRYDGNYRARFTYDNPNPETVHIPAGENNAIQPHGPNRGQATSFNPGTHGLMFEVDFDGHDLTWSLTSPNGETRQVTANLYTESCPDVPPPANDEHDDYADNEEYGEAEYEPDEEAEESSESHDETILPILFCVTGPEGDNFRARFGYDNPTSATVHIPAGDDNNISPDGPNRGQATSFNPGLHEFAFEVNFDGHDLTWSLTSPNGETHQVTANDQTESCP